MTTKNNRLETTLEVLKGLGINRPTNDYTTNWINYLGKLSEVTNKLVGKDISFLLGSYVMDANMWQCEIINDDNKVKTVTPNTNQLKAIESAALFAIMDVTQTSNDLKSAALAHAIGKPLDALTLLEVEHGLLISTRGEKYFVCTNEERIVAAHHNAFKQYWRLQASDLAEIFQIDKSFFNSILYCNDSDSAKNSNLKNLAARLDMLDELNELAVERIGFTRILSYYNEHIDLGMGLHAYKLYN